MILALTPFKVFLVAFHLIFPDGAIELHEMAFPTEEACVHFVGDVLPAFEAIMVEANPGQCIEQTWYYEDGSI